MPESSGQAGIGLADDALRRTVSPAHDAAAPSRGEAVLAAALLLAGLSVSITFGWSCGDGSGNGLIHYDDLTHYLYAKWAWHWPAYLVDSWGRPGFTIPYALPARFGWRACRVLSAILSAAGAWLALRIAQRLGLRHAWAVIPLAYAQPLFFQLSQTTLTETPLALYLTAAVYLALGGRWTGSAAFLSASLVTRHEAIVLLPVWLILARRQGERAWRLWPVLVAPVLVNLFAWGLGLRTAIAALLEPAPSTEYGHGGWLTFFARALHAWGPGVAILAMIGCPALVRRRGGGWVVWTMGVYFAAQTIIRALGLYASGGYARFLVPISPLVAVAALCGWARLRHAAPAVRRRAALLAGAGMLLLWWAMECQLVLHAGRDVELPEIHLAAATIRISTVVFVLVSCAVALHTLRPRWVAPEKALLPACITLLMLLAVPALHRPLQRPAEAALIDAMLSELAGRGLEDREIITANAWLDHTLGHAWPPNRTPLREQLRRAPPGTLFAWESQFAPAREHDLPFDALRNSGAFRVVLQTPPRDHEETPYMTVFEKLGPWTGTPAAPE